MQTRAYVDGRWVDGSGTFSVDNPADGSPVAEVADCGAEHTREAIQAADGSFEGWRSLPARERGAALVRWHDVIRRDQERLARLMTLEQGKPLAESRGEVAYGAEFLRWSAAEAERVYGEIIPASTTQKRILVLRQPVGVAAAITPWNFPLAMITRKVGPALAAGCTTVVKPAEQTPLTALALAELAEEVGLPAGVFNVVPTSRPASVGDALMLDPRVRKVSFTGSTAVGRILVRAASQNLTRLSLELGGQAPVLVFDDADLDVAVDGIVAAKFRNAGQTCVCINRIYAQRGIADALTRRLVEAVRTLTVGPGDVEGVTIGPLIDDDAMAKVQLHVDDALEHGARIAVGGAARKDLGTRYYAPTVLADASDDMLVMTEETFGPVAPVRVFDDEADAIRMANDTDFGLAAYFFTRDASRLMRVAEALEYGIIGANDGRPSTPQAPFGGFKSSGWGREGGKYGMEAYLETKFVSWAL